MKTEEIENPKVELVEILNGHFERDGANGLLFNGSVEIKIEGRSKTQTSTGYFGVNDFDCKAWKDFFETGKK